jgi:hypothetical protein
MTVAPEPRPGPPRPPSRGRLGLRLRLWLACLGGTLVAGAGALWVLAPLDLSSVEPDGDSLAVRMLLVLVLGVVVSAALAAWIDLGIVGRLRALNRRLDVGTMPEMGTNRGWGELAMVAGTIESMLVRQRQLTWSMEELDRLKRELAAASAAVESWSRSERWESPVSQEGPLKALLDPLDRGLVRQRDVAEQNQEAARQVRNDLLACLESARESAAHAEHGFVEATASLTSVNEFTRLAAELQQGLTDRPAARESGARPFDAWRGAATSAIEELATGASESVEHLALAFMRVQEIGEQVQQLSNRATLIALHTLLTGTRADETEEGQDGLHGELKQLAIEVRSATTRVADLSHELEREIQAATERMRGIRERVALRLEQIPETSESAETGPSDELRRLLDRLREMAQDGARKSERVTRSTERSSRAAQDVVRRIEEESADLEGVIVRLSPGSFDALESRLGETSRPSGLKVIERRPNPPGDSQQTRGRGESA